MRDSFIVPGLMVGQRARGRWELLLYLLFLPGVIWGQKVSDVNLSSRAGGS